MANERTNEVAELERKLKAALRAHKRTKDRWSQIESIENKLARLRATKGS